MEVNSYKEKNFHTGDLETVTQVKPKVGGDATKKTGENPDYALHNRCKPTEHTQQAELLAATFHKMFGDI